MRSQEAIPPTIRATMSIHVMIFVMLYLGLLKRTESTSTATSGGGEGARGEGWKDGRASKIGGW
jgi:hypothetical protein